MVADSRGVPDFGLLHADLAAGRQDRVLYCAFDLLYLDGFDLRGAPLVERKRLLSEILAGASPMPFTSSRSKNAKAAKARGCGSMILPACSA